MWNKNGLKPWNWSWNEKGEQISCQIALDDAGFDKSNNNSLPDCVLTTLCVAIDSCQIRGWLPAVYNTWSNNKRQCWSTSNNHNRFIIALDRYDHISYMQANLFELTFSTNTTYVKVFIKKVLVCQIISITTPHNKSCIAKLIKEWKKESGHHTWCRFCQQQVPVALKWSDVSKLLKVKPPSSGCWSPGAIPTLWSYLQAIYLRWPDQWIPSM